MPLKKWILATWLLFVVNVANADSCIPKSFVKVGEKYDMGQLKKVEVTKYIGGCWIQGFVQQVNLMSGGGKHVVYVNLNEVSFVKITSQINQK